MANVSRLPLVAALTVAACGPNGSTQAPAPPSACAHRGTIVFVLTAEGTQTLRNGKVRSTGFFLNEFYEAYRAVTDAGYDVAIATLGGRRPVVDPESAKPNYWDAHPAWRAEAEALVKGDPRFEEPLSVEEVRRSSADYEGVVVPGGQGVMIDLVEDADLQQLIIHHGEQGKAVGLICHAPSLLTRLPSPNPFEGRRVTSVSGFEEFYIERFIMKGRAQKRGIERRLKQKGYRHRSAFPGKSRAIRDRNLVTSQNPFSGDDFARSYVEALGAQRRHAGCNPAEHADG